MASPTTPNLGIYFLPESGAGAYIYYNNSIALLDALLGCAVVNMTTSAPPGSPAVSDRYIISTSPTGVWAGQAGNLAYLLNGAWAFEPPFTGMTLWNKSTNTFEVFNGSSWVNLSTSIGGGTPTFSVGAGAGTGGSASLISGSTNDKGGISVTTGTAPSSGATVVTITFSTAYSTTTFPVLEPANEAAALLSGVTAVYVTGTTTTFVITSGTTGLTSATTYQWNWRV